MKNILTFSASNSSNSINRQLLNAAVSKIAGQEVQETDIRDYPMPMYSTDLELQQGFPETAKVLRAQFAQADAFIFSIPEHNGSMPAVFKNVIDWLSRLADQENPLFASKPVLLLSTAPGPRGGMTNLQTLTQIMPFWGADVRGSFSLGSFQEHLSEGKLSADKDRQLSDTIQGFVSAL